MKVGIILVSHSRAVSQAVIELARQLAPEVPMLGVGGDADSGFGANAGEVIAACDELERSCDHVVVIADLGSSLLAVEAAIDYRRLTGCKPIVTMGRGPFVEGAIAASVAARGDGTLEQVMEAIALARSIWQTRQDSVPDDEGSAVVVSPPDFSDSEDSDVFSTSRSVPPQLRHVRDRRERAYVSLPEDADVAGEARGVSSATKAGTARVSLRATRSMPEPCESGEIPAVYSRRVSVKDAAGLHARPAAILSTMAASLDTEVLINAIPASSMMELLVLEIECGDEVLVSGENAADVDIIADAIAHGLDLP